MGGTLWLEAKAILGGSGPVCSARGLSGTGCGVRCSQPRAKPSDSYVPHLPMVTHSNQVEARENARVGTARRGSSAHSTTESYATFLRECGQHGPLSARCRDVHVGARSGRSTPACGSALPASWCLWPSLGAAGSPEAGWG